MKICVIIVALIGHVISKKKGQVRSQRQIFTNSTNIAPLENNETDLKALSKIYSNFFLLIFVYKFWLTN